MGERQAARAAALRRQWFDLAVPSILASDPEAYPVTEAASLSIDEDGLVEVHLPVAKEFQKALRASCSEALEPLLREGEELAVDAKATIQYAPRRRQPSPGDIHHEGDAPPAQWAELEQRLMGNVRSESKLAFMHDAKPTAFARFAVWIELPMGVTPAMLGKTPGAAFAMHEILAGWDKSFKAFLYTNDALVS